MGEQVAAGSLKKLLERVLYIDTDISEWVEKKTKPVSKDVLTRTSREVLLYITGFNQ